MLQALIYIINEIILIFSLLLLFRFQVSLSKARLPWQVQQVIAKLTNWCMLPLRSFFSKFRWEWSAVLLVYLLQLAFLLLFRGRASELYALIYPIFSTLTIYLQLLTYLLIAQVFFSWLRPEHEMYRSLLQLSAPFLHPLQKRLPLVANIDFSPVVALLIIQFIKIILQ